jgi:uncharacterized protein (DUF302 family)
MAGDGLITVRSEFRRRDMVNRFDAEVRAKGRTIFAHIDHAAGAEEAGLSLRPTDLFIFGNARGCTKLMQSGQTIGIDPPLKVLIWCSSVSRTPASRRLAW